MTDYRSLSTEPKQFQALTGYTVAEFDALLPAFTAQFEAQMQLRYAGRSTPPAALCQLPQQPLADAGR